MLEHILTKLELSPKEEQIYSLIIEHGKIAPALLARLTRINRTTVYSVAAELKAKGLIIEDLGGKTMYYVPAGAGELEKVIEEKENKHSEHIKVLKELQETLQVLPLSTIYSVPRIRFIDEANLERYLHEATSRWQESLAQAKESWWGFQDHTFVERFEGWIDWFWKRAPETLSLRLLTNDSEIESKLKEKEYRQKRNMKFLQSNEFTATQWVLGSSVVFIVTKQRPFYLVEINDSVIAHNFRELFKQFWVKL